MYVSNIFTYHPVTVADCCDIGRRVTIDMLPDVALLEIFDCYVEVAREEEIEEYKLYRRLKIQGWHTLVHVCRKWRIIVLGSPRRLGLRLLCREKTPVKETLSVWPPLPIVIKQFYPTQMENIILALEHNERICKIDLIEVTNSQQEEVLAAMQQPFPALTKLRIWLYQEGMPTVIPESFLGGSAPRLQYLELEHIQFPGLPNLLLSAPDLVDLHITRIPHSGYISPEVMVHCLSTLTRLEGLSLVFESPKSRPVWKTRRPYPPKRSTLLTLTYFRFGGVSEYLEDLVARINAPLLDNFNVTFFHQLIFNTPQLAQFFARTPNFQSLVGADIAFVFFEGHVLVKSPETYPYPYPRGFQLKISCKQSDWQLSSLAQVCSSSFPHVLIRMVEHLHISQAKYKGPRRWQDDIEGSQWLEALRPFTGLKDLYVSREFLPRIAPAFQELAGEPVTEVLPALQSLFLEKVNPSGPVREATKKLVVARHLAGHPITVSHWDRKQDLMYP